MNHNRDLLLGIDVGGTGVKAGAYTLDGHMLGQGYAELGLISTFPGQAEQHAEQWWEKGAMAIRQAIEKINPSNIKAVGISCTNAVVAVDRECTPLHPALMLWDQRAVAEVDTIRSVLGGQEVERITGNQVAPGTYYLPSILWLKNNFPALFQKTEKFLVPGGFLIAKLTGNMVIDYTRACTSQLFDIRKIRWHEPFFRNLDIPLTKMPEAMPSTEVAGFVTDEAERITGLPSGTPVAAGVTDTIAAMIGTHSLKPGKSLIIMGTAARVTRNFVQPSFDTRLMNFVSVMPDQWVGLAAINGVGSALGWLRDEIATKEREAAKKNAADVYDVITALAAQSPAGAMGLILVPYLAGERTPVWDANARGLLFGLTISHRRADIFRAFLEGPAFAIRQGVEIIDSGEAQRPLDLSIAGAATKSELWNQIICNVVGRPLHVVHTTHVEVLGAAILGGVAAKLYPDLNSGMDAAMQSSERIEPDPQTHQLYNTIYSLYKKLYPQNQALFAELNRLELPLS